MCNKQARTRFEPGFQHLTGKETRRMIALLKRQKFLQERIKAAASHGIDLAHDKAEEGALCWAIDWIRKTRNEEGVVSRGEEDRED